jgi:hypothetical protein
MILSATLCGAPIVIPVDSAASGIQVELCVSGACDTDSSPLTGYVTIWLDSVDAPALIMLHDFDVQATQDLNHHLSWGAFGQFDSTLSGAALWYATPGWPTGPEPIVADTFSFLNVPVLAAGTLTYTAAGLPCVALQGAGLPCADTHNLADEGQQTADQFSGTITSDNRVVTLDSNVYVQSPLDPLNPGLGTITISGNIHGQVYVPEAVPGDFDGNGQVNLNDFATFSVCFANPVTGSPPGCSFDQAYESDFDRNGTVNLNDFATFAVNFEG